jgi:hypothetical protein
LGHQGFSKQLHAEQVKSVPCSTVTALKPIGSPSSRTSQDNSSGAENRALPAFPQLRHMKFSVHLSRSSIKR